MDTLKKILRLAVKNQAMRVKIAGNAPTELVTPQGTLLLNELGQMAPDYPSMLCQALMSEDFENITKGVACKGSMNLVNIGEVKLLAEPGDVLSIKLYLPPSGENMFQEAWSKVKRPPANLPPPPAGVADLGSIPLSGQIPPGQDFVPPPPSVAAAIPSPPIPVEKKPAPAAGGFVLPPTGIDLVGKAPATLDVPPPPMAKISSGSASTETRKPDLAVPMTTPSLSMPAPDLTAEPNNGSPFSLGAATSEVDKNIDEPKSDPKAIGLDMPKPIEVANAPEPIKPPTLTMETPSTTAASMEPQVASTTFGSTPAAQDNASPSGSKITFGSVMPGETVTTSTVDKPIDAILREMVDKGASDVHFSAMEPYAFRIDGEIVRYNNNQINPARMEELLLPIMPNRNVQEFLEDSDTDFAYEVPGLARFRVNMFRDRQGVGAVLRQIPAEVLTAEQLGLPDALRKFTMLSKGLVVVTGPTGSGKSTTLAAMIDLINKSRKDHLLTIEDPIEFVHKQHQCLVNQREVHKHTNSFSRALKAALREDPDIILIGELRDLETISIAIETAETGHLVFGTLHTTTAISTVDRIIDQFPSDQQSQVRMMLAESLRGVVAQTLLKKEGGGRVAAHEILVVDKAVSNLIREEKTHMIMNHMQTKKKDGNQMLNEVLSKLVVEGTVAPREAYIKSVDKDGLLIMFNQNNINFNPIETLTKKAG